jgi:hypothetical protein
MQIFSNTKVMMNPKYYHPFGCPVFILDNALQHNGPFHKWKEHSRVRIYLGQSPAHSRNVALVLDRRTGLVSPQFHVKYDLSFHSVMQDTFDSKWQERAGFIKQEPAPKRKTTKQKASNNKKQKAIQLADIPVIPASEGGLQGPEGALDCHTEETDKMPASEGAKHTKDQTITTQRISARLQPNKEHQTPTTTKHQQLKTPQNMGQTEESQNMVQSLKTPMGSISMATPTGSSLMADQVHNKLHLIEAMIAEISEATKQDIEGEILCLEAMFPMGHETYNDMLMEHDPLYAYKVAKSDPDTMYLHEAMREADSDKFKEAMLKEVNDQEMDNGNFTVVPKSKVPKGKTILPTVWQMRRKRDICMREVKNYKARLNINGSRMQQGIHYNQTYAPVASWKFIRLLLIMVAKNGWYSKQLDYVLAFPQAPVEKEIYMIPKGFELNTPNANEEHVLKLHKYIYGQKQAGRVWNKYLVDKLVNELKFKQSKVDECIFYRGKSLYVLYTDDSLLAGPDQK